FLERTREMIAVQASRVTGATSDSLQVVIKPSEGTQLSLDLRQRGNGIDAQAVLQQGDFAQLKQQWPELQQQLEKSGIRLAPLTEQTHFNNGNQGDFQRQTNHPSTENDS